MTQPTNKRFVMEDKLNTQMALKANNIDSTITNSGTGTKPLIVGAIAGTTVNLQEWKVNGIEKASIDAGGGMHLTTTLATAGLRDNTAAGPFVNLNSNSLGLYTRNAANVGLLLQGAASQTGDYIQVKDSTGVPLVRMNAAGVFQSTGGATPGLVVQGNGNLNATITAATTGGGTVTYTAANTFQPAQTVTITGVLSTGNPTGTAGAGFNLTAVTIATASATQFTVTNALTDTYTSGGAALVPFSGDIFNAKSNGGTSFIRVNNSGQLFINGGVAYVGTLQHSSNNVNTVYASTGITNATSAAANVPLTVQNSAATPTGNLQEWVRTAGVVASIDATGALAAPSAGLTGQSATVAPLSITNGTILTTPVIGSIESASGNVLYSTGNTTTGNGRQVVNASQFGVLAAGASVASGAAFFPTRNPYLIAGHTYRFNYAIRFTKATAGTLTYGFTVASGTQTTNARVATFNVTGTASTGVAVNAAGAAGTTSVATASLVDLTSYTAIIDGYVTPSASGRFTLIITDSAGTVTSVAGGASVYDFIDLGPSQQGNIG